MQIERRKFDRDNIRPLNVGMIQFSGCSMCCLEVMDALNFRMKVPTNIVMSPWNFEIENYHDHKNIPEMDICFVEGAIGSEEDETELKRIREQTRFLVCVGTCAVSEKMNISMMKNEFSSLKSRLPEEVVTVDRIVKGCKIKDKGVYKMLIELFAEFDDDYYKYLSETEQA